jgi:cbb3-type cytochrome oxidase maturation protein
MTILYLLIPVTLGLGLVALAAFLWSLRNGQYEDLAGAAERVLLDGDPPGSPAGRDHPERVASGRAKHD